MGRKVTITRDYLNQLKNRVERLETERNRIEEDRKKHQEFYLKILKYNLELLGKGMAMNSEWFSLELAKHFNRVERWYW